MRKTPKTEIWSLNSKGEIIYEKLNQTTKKKYEPDSPFLHPVVPYVLLILCGLTDFCVFGSMFNMVTYDNEVMKAFSIVGLLIGFDIIPIFIGVHYRRLRQGLVKDRMMLVIALMITLLAVFLNIGLRVTTIDEMSPAGSFEEEFAFGSSSLAGSKETDGNEEAIEQSEESELSGLDATAVALTVFGCLLPVVTSAGSFYVSYLTYDPLLMKKQREEVMINEKKDEIRRLKAVVLDYEEDADFEKMLIEFDNNMYDIMRREQRIKAVYYCNYVQQRLKEHLGDPASNNALSADNIEYILQCMNRALETMYDKDIQKFLIRSSQVTMTPASITEAAA